VFRRRDGGRALPTSKSRCGFFSQGCSAVRRARRDAPYRRCSARSASAPYRFTEAFNGRARPSRRAEVCQAA